MERPINTVVPEETPTYRIEVLKARLRARGYTYTVLAEQLGVGAGVINKAIYARVSEALEREIAAAAATTPYEVWPDRYHPTGERRDRGPRRPRRRGGAA